MLANLPNLPNLQGGREIATPLGLFGGARRPLFHVSASFAKLVGLVGQVGRRPINQWVIASNRMRTR